MNDRTKAALIGGLIAGVLSGVPYIGGCCFLWALGGGFLAIYMIMKNTTAPLEMGEGAKIGAIAGAIALVPFLIIRIIYITVVGVSTVALSQDQNAGAIAGIVAAGGIVVVVIGAVVVVAFAVLGGVIGVAVLGKGRAGAPPPPPPPAAGGYGGPGM